MSLSVNFHGFLQVWEIENTKAFQIERFMTKTIFRIGLNKIRLELSNIFCNHFFINSNSSKTELKKYRARETEKEPK